MRDLRNRKRLQRWGALFGIGCFAAGILAPLLGMILLGIEWVAGAAKHPWLHFTSTALLVVGIPLILFAGFCLDWSEREQTAALRKPTNIQRDPKRLTHTAHFSQPS